MRTVTGEPNPKHVSTSYVERQNLTMRMSMRRFTRLTNAFSKKVEMHAQSVALHFMYYNFVKIHATLRTTPAQAAGVTDRLWEVSDLVGLLRLPARSPNLNAYAERFVRSIKDECLNRVVPLGEGHLRRLVHEYVQHYHRERNHQGRDNQLLERAPPPLTDQRAEVLRRARLGRLLNFYYREAA